jgi:hypothetical protein
VDEGDEMDFKDLTPEQQEKVRACETTEEVLALAKEEGYELTDEDLDGISGGWECKRFKPFVPGY